MQEFGNYKASCFDMSVRHPTTATGDGSFGIATGLGITTARAGGSHL